MIKLRRLLLTLLVAVGLFLAAFFGWVYYSQDSMIYEAKKYLPGELKLVPQGATQLKFTTPAGRQTAWYFPPSAAEDTTSTPETLWILFSGNASLALHWTDVVRKAPDTKAGYLLIEYPGYGESEGKPSPSTIAEASEVAIAALAEHLKVDKTVLESGKIRLLGYSLGAAVALDFATRHKVDRIVLAAPFTTMKAMADRIVKPHLSWLLAHRFDNIKSIEALAGSANPPRIIITHGIPDPAVPIEMSRELMARWPDLIELVEVPHANHTSILDDIHKYMGKSLPDPLPADGVVSTNPGTGDTSHSVELRK